MVQIAMAVPQGAAVYFSPPHTEFFLSGILTSLSRGLTLNRLLVVSDNCQCSGDLRGTPSGDHLPKPS